MRKLFNFITVCLAVSSITGCLSLKDLENRVDVLESKLDALEKTIELINGNVEVMKTFVEGGIAINSVSQINDTYIIEFANGQKVTLDQGTLGESKTPIVSIDEQGYWTVNYGDGPQRIGDGIKAVGENALAPIFGVDQTRTYWTYSSDGGVTFELVKDSSGNPVTLEADGRSSDRFFKDVEYDGHEFRLTLSDGRVLQLPIVSSFYFRILGAENSQTFRYGQTRTYQVERNGVDNTILTVPDGWKASLTENTLTITAPEVGTKAINSDTDSDVSILAVSTNGYASIARLKVELYIDMWKRYEEGKDIYVGGKTINKQTHPGAVLLTQATSTITNGIYFLEPGIEQPVSTNNNQLIIIGRYYDRRSTIVKEKYTNVNSLESDDHIILANVEFKIGDPTQRNALFVQLGDSDFEEIIFDNVAFLMNAKKGSESSILLSFVYSEGSPNRIMTGNITIADCDIKIDEAVAGLKIYLVNSTLTNMPGPVVKIYGNHIYSDLNVAKFYYVNSVSKLTSLDTHDNEFTNVNVL